MSKKLGSKLADSVRQAKQQNEASTTHAGASAAPQTKPATKSAASGKFAGQNDQAPKSSLDNPWANLYPERIWPD